MSLPLPTHSNKITLYMKKLGKLLVITSLLLCFFISGGWAQRQAKNQPDSIELKLKEIYTKREVMIPMRDGVKL